MIGARVANELWLLTARPHHQALERALRDPGRAQARLLGRILSDNRGSRVGRRLGFADIDSPRAFRSRVPLVRYDQLGADVDAIASGERRVLTSEPVRRLCPSGGTVRQKLVPFTRALGRDFARGVGAWVTDLAERYPAIKSGPAYWSVSPAFETPEPSGGAVPVGFDDDAAYLGRWLEPLVRRTLVAPNALRHARPLASFQYATARHLLAARELRLISVWHPSFLMLVLDAARANWERLVEDVARGTLDCPIPLDPALSRRLTRSLRPDPERARALRRLGPDAPVAALWPKLVVVSAWGDAAAAGPCAALQARLGAVPVQPKGLLATEGFVSVPFGGAHPVAITSTYVELLDEDGRVTELAAARVGASYEVVITTSGGLYRYRLGDRVRVTGRLGATPTIRLVGRVDRVVDLVGEKLCEEAALAAISRAFEGAPPGFAMLAPDGAGYTLFVDRPPADEPSLARRLEAELRRVSPGYAYAVGLGQLAPVTVALTAADAEARYLARGVARGQRLGDIKPAALSAEGDWRDRLDARSLSRRELASDRAGHAPPSPLEEIPA